jgi:hypothetical protein
MRIDKIKSSMLFKKLTLLTILISSLKLTVLHSQETISAAGSNTVGNGGSISYTVGQVIYSNYSGINGSLLQGVQQPNEISLLTSHGSFKELNLSLSAYPNPVSDYLLLTIEKFDNSNFIFRLYDIQGKLLLTRKIVEYQTNIDMKSFAPSTYLLKITKDKKEIKTFKINRN